jgi:hypothetical protein
MLRGVLSALGHYPIFSPAGPATPRVGVIIGRRYDTKGEALMARKKPRSYSGGSGLRRLMDEAMHLREKSADIIARMKALELEVAKAHQRAHDLHETPMPTSPPKRKSK